MSVRAVVMKGGEKIEFPEDSLTLLAGDRVMSFPKGARLVAVGRSNGVITRGTEVVSVRVKDKSYRNPPIVAETTESITFVAGATAPDREIPLAQIDDPWLQEEGGLHWGAKVGIAVLTVCGVLVAIVSSRGARRSPPC